MKKSFIYTLIALVVLTISTAFVATHTVKNAGIIILILSAVKFLLVAFEFMEVKKAHPFWKTILIVYLVLFVTIMSFII